MTDSLSTLLDLFYEREFLWGVALGAIALGVVVTTYLLRRQAPWALLTAVAVIVGLPLIDQTRRPLVLGVVVLAAGGWLLDRAAARIDATGVRVAGWAIVVVGGILIGLATPADSARWIAPAAVIVTIALGALLARWNQMAEAEWLGSMFAIAAFGTWTTVPDTELARLLLGVAVVTSVGTIRPIHARVTTAGALALAGVFAWLPTIGGAPRPASIIGAWTCVGMIAVLPVVRHRWSDRSTIPVWQVLALHAAIALVGARVIGLWTWAIPAVLASTGLFFVTIAAVRWSGSSDRRAARR